MRTEPFLNHEPHVALRGDRRYQTHAVTCPGRRDDRGLAFLAPSASCVMIGADMGRIAGIDVGFWCPGHPFDFRVFRLQPSLHQGLIPLDRSMRRLLRRNAKPGQQAPYRIRGQADAPFFLDQPGHHLACPQCELKPELQRVLLCHRIIDPLELPAIQLRRTPRQRLRLECAPTAATIQRKPSVQRAAGDP